MHSSLVQWQDFGQKSFGPIKCKNCGMLYYKGEVDDEELHKKFHSRLIDGVQFAVSVVLMPCQE